MDQVEFPGWRGWLTGRVLITVIGAAITLLSWWLLPPAYPHVISVLYVTVSLGYAVWDGWALRWAIPVSVLVAGFFAWPYLTAAQAHVMGLLRDRTSLHTLTLIGVIVWAVLASVSAVVLGWRTRNTEGRR